MNNSLKKKKEYWSGLPLPSPGDLPDPGIEPVAPAITPALKMDSFTAETVGKPLLFKIGGT